MLLLKKIFTHYYSFNEAMVLITLPEGWCQIKNIWNKIKSTDFETR